MRLPAEVAAQLDAAVILARLPVDPDADQHRADLATALDATDAYAAAWLERKARAS